jgi:hypothetical protein
MKKNIILFLILSIIISLVVIWITVILILQIRQNHENEIEEKKSIEIFRNVSFENDDKFEFDQIVAKNVKIEIDWFDPLVLTVVNKNSNDLPKFIAEVDDSSIDTIVHSNRIYINTNISKMKQISKQTRCSEIYQNQFFFVDFDGNFEVFLHKDKQAKNISKKIKRILKILNNENFLVLNDSNEIVLISNDLQQKINHGECIELFQDAKTVNNILITFYKKCVYFNFKKVLFLIEYSQIFVVSDVLFAAVANDGKITLFEIDIENLTISKSETNNSNVNLQGLLQIVEIDKSTCGLIDEFSTLFIFGENKTFQLPVKGTILFTTTSKQNYFVIFVKNEENDVFSISIDLVEKKINNVTNRTDLKNSLKISNSFIYFENGTLYFPSKHLKNLKIN